MANQVIPEKVVENAIFHFVKLLGIFAFKHDSVGIFDTVKKTHRKSGNRHRIRGVSDILGVLDGRFIAIEVKSAKGRLSPHQKVFIANVIEAGGIAFVARSVDDVKRELKVHFTSEQLKF